MHRKVSAGVDRSENGGMSSEKLVRIQLTECPRFPEQRSSTPGEAALTRGHIGVVDGLLVNIPVLGYYRYELGRDALS